jgi:hypothetical protein
MHHKRHRTKSQRAGCLCGNKELKHNGFPEVLKLRGIARPFPASDVDLVAEGVVDYEDEVEDIDEASLALANSCRHADYLDSLE